MIQQMKTAIGDPETKITDELDVIKKNVKDIRGFIKETNTRIEISIRLSARHWNHAVSVPVKHLSLIWLVQRLVLKLQDSLLAIFSMMKMKMQSQQRAINSRSCWRRWILTRIFQSRQQLDQVANADPLAIIQSNTGKLSNIVSMKSSWCCWASAQQELLTSNFVLILTPLSWTWLNDPDQLCKLLWKVM